jgi:hypothetical protein
MEGYEKANTEIGERSPRFRVLIVDLLSFHSDSKVMNDASREIGKSSH